MPEAHSEKSRMYALATVLGTGVCLCVAIALGTGSYLSRLEDRIAEERDRTVQAQSTLAAASQVTQQVTRTEEYLAQWRRRHTPPGRITQVVSELASTAEASGLVTTRMVPDGTTNHGWLRETRIRLTVSGTAEEVLRFLRQAEQIGHEVWVNTLVVEATDDPDDPVSCAIDFVAYGEESGFSG